MQERCVLASNNAGKLREFADLLAPLGWQVVAQSMLGIPEANEPYPTFIENALAKARHAARGSGLPALADDSGLCVPVLGNAPGVRSARYAGEPKSDARNNQALIHDLQRTGTTDWRAFYVAVLAWVRHADDPLPVVVEARWAGHIVTQAQGSGGFGYDPHFWVATHGCTAAQLPADVKNAMSHRGQAVRALLARLRIDAEARPHS